MNYTKYDSWDAVDYLQDCVMTGRITRDDLMEVVNGNRSRISEIMNKKRNLSLNQIRRLYFDHGLDPDMLLRPIKEIRK